MRDGYEIDGLRLCSGETIECICCEEGFHASSTDDNVDVYEGRQRHNSNGKNDTAAR